MALASIDITVRKGKYQPIAAYAMVSGGNTDHPRDVADSEARKELVKDALIAAGFQQVGPHTWVHLSEQLQARICVDCTDDHVRRGILGKITPKGELIHGTIGVEIWDEPNAELL